MTIINNLKKLPKITTESWYKKNFREFCLATCLHGYNYIQLENLTKIERFAWAIIVFVATIVSILLIILSYQWDLANATTTVIESTHFPIQNTPFPAVTICNVNKISKLSAYRMASKMIRPNGTSIDDLSYMFRMILHYQGIGQSITKEYMKLHGILSENNYTIVKLLSEISPKCSDMLIRCIWKGKQIRCENIFQTITTSYGICCSFNNLAMRTTNYDGVAANLRKNKQPLRHISCSYETGLSILMKPNATDYHSSFISIIGFRVFIHNSYHYVDDNVDTTYIDSASETFLPITPDFMSSSLSLKNLPPKERNCFLYSDFRLNVMQNYSYSNCMSECRSRILFQLCNCVPYNSPNNGSMRTCEMNDIDCFNKYRFIFNAGRPGQRLWEEYSLKNWHCGCLSDCEVSNYITDANTAKLNRRFSTNNKQMFKGVKLDDECLIHIYFNDLVSTLYRHDTSQNWIGVLASFGGLLGLFLGFSFVAAFEMIYFFTFRPVFDYCFLSTATKKLLIKKKIKNHRLLIQQIKNNRHR